MNSNSLFIAALCIFSLTLNGISLEKDFPDLKEEYSDHVDFYCINRGDSIKSIALNYKVSPSFILYLNSELEKAENFYIGKVVKVPGKSIKDTIESRGQYYVRLINKLGHDSYRTRKSAEDKLVEHNWRVVPLLLKHKKHQNVEIRGNIKTALERIFTDFTRPDNLSF